MSGMNPNILTKVSALVERIKDQNKKDVAKYRVRLNERKPLIGNVLVGNYYTIPHIDEEKPYYATVTYSKDKPLLARYYMNDKEYALAHELIMRHELDEVKSIKRILDDHGYKIPKKLQDGLLNRIKQRWALGKEVMNAIYPEKIYSHVSPEVLLEESKNVAHKEVPKNVKGYFKALRTLTGEKAYMRGYGHEMYSGDKAETKAIIAKRRERGYFGDENLIYNFPLTIPETIVEMVKAKTNGPDYIRVAKRGM